MSDAASTAGVQPLAKSLRLEVGGASFDVSLEGDCIAALQVDIGQRHRGVEKECEGGPWYRVLPYTERLCAQSSAFASVGFCLAVERLICVETPVRCQWLRVLASELTRIADHLSRIANTCSALGVTSASGAALEARDLAGDVLAALCGARSAPGWSRIGGLARAMPADLPAFARDTLGRVPSLVKNVERTASRAPFTRRLRDVAVFGREQCIRYAVTGPALRAAGEPFDLRKSSPYLVYDQIDFDVPTGEVGDNYDRFLVCLEEIHQSLRIVLQGLDQLQRLGPGAVDIDDPSVRWPAKGLVAAGLEEHIQHFHGVTKGPRVPAGQTYLATESAGGELGFYLVSDGSERPLRVRCRAASFSNLQALPEMLRGVPQAELLATHALLNIVASECDR